MRTRVLIGAGTVLGVSVIGQGTAFAAAKQSEQGECVRQAVESGRDASTCIQAPNPILPATNEIIWGAISFLVLFFLLWKFAFPAVKKGMDARADRIRHSLDEAERTRADAQQILEEYQHQLADARSEAGHIIEEARQAADAMRRELMARAEADAAATRERAQADIAAQVERATADLRAQVAQLSVEAAELVLQRQLRDRDTQVRLVEDYINRVGATRG